MENKYPEYIMRILRVRRNLDDYDTTEDIHINDYSADRVFEEICEWEGFINYANTIRRWIKDIYKVDLEGK